MHKKIAASLLGVLMLTTPVFASAQTVDQALIDSLRAQLLLLQQQLAQLLHSQNATEPDDTSTDAPEPSPVCPGLYFSRTLSLGMSGEDVRGLQKFLILRSLLAAGNDTGYFGRQTEAAVKAFQGMRGIDQVGIAGRLTRAALVEYCSTISTEQGGTGTGGSTGTGAWNFTASPNSGTAPMTVSFRATAGDEQALHVDFGDGTTGAMSVIEGGAARGASHTYTAAGTYTAKLLKAQDCPAGYGCPAVLQTVATLSISVSSQQNNAVTWTVTPVSGTAPLQVTLSAGNLANSGVYFVEYGDGTSATICNQNSSGTAHCGLSWSGTHTYAAAGTYSAKLQHQPTCGTGASCMAALQNVGSVTVTVSAASTNLNFSASPTSGTAPLSVSFTAQVQGNNYYTINYGDGTSGTMNSAVCQGGCNPYPITSTHTYAAPGTYTAKLFDSRLECFTGDCAVATAVVSVSSSGSAVSWSATPLSGSAPLTVSFTSNVAGIVTFGDGTGTGTLSPAPVCASCAPAYTLGHVYQNPGSYSATLFTSNTQQNSPITVSVASAVPVTITLGNSTFVTSGMVSAGWAAATGAAASDWIAAVPTGTNWSPAQSTSGLWVWATTNTKTQGAGGASSGNISLSNVPAGQYQLVYYLNTKDGNGNYIEKARSATFSVLEVSSTY